MHNKTLLASIISYTINNQDKTYHVHFFEQDQEFVYGVEK